MSTPLYVCLCACLRPRVVLPLPPVHSVSPAHVTMRPEEAPVLNSPFPSLQYGSGIGDAPSATHDTSRVSYHVKHLDSFAQTLQEVRYSLLLSYRTASIQVN